MTIWEKAILNMEKGSKKISAAAATFSDRVKMEIALARLRIRIDETQSRIDELHRAIGRKIVSLGKGSALPEATDQLLKDEEVAAALSELVARERELAELKSDFVNVRGDFKDAVRQTEETLK